MRTVCTLALALLATAGAASAQPLTDADLDGRKFMHRGSFEADRGWSWSRDDLELEAAYTVHNIPGHLLYRLLRQDRRNGQPLRGDLFEDDNRFRDVRRQPACEAFAIGYPIDEVPWDAARHAIREQSPYVWLTIERGNYDVDGQRGRRRISLGTDLMDDEYFDTDSYILLDHHMTLRGRKRYDRADRMRRILIGTKEDRGVDEFGIKQAAKVDVRSDSPRAEAIAGMDDMVRSGILTWGSSPEVAAPCRELYRRLLARGVTLPSTPTYQDVLLVDPKAFVRSVRSRYHLDEVRLDAVRNLHDLGRQRLEALLATAREARMDGAIPAAQVDAVRAWEERVRAVLDRTALLERAAPRLLELDLQLADVTDLDALVPTAPLLAATSTIDDIAEREVELLRRKVVAEALSELYHEVAADLAPGGNRSLRRALARAHDRVHERHVDWYQAFLREQDARAYGALTTLDKFVAAARDLQALPAGEQAAALAAYNGFGRAQLAAGVRAFRRFEPLPADGVDALVRLLTHEQLEIWMRQIEAAGTAGQGLWFDQARAFYIPRSRRTSGNFLIDTMDFTMMFPMSVWDGVDPADRTAARQLPDDQLVGCVLVNDVQIELPTVSAFTDRLRRLGSALKLARGLMAWGADTNHPALAGGADAAAYLALRSAVTGLQQAERDEAMAAINARIGPTANYSSDDLAALDATLFTPEVRDGEAPPSLAVALAGARFILEQYFRAQALAAEVKGERVVSVLKEAGGPDGMVWAPVTSSKGEMALRLVRDQASGGGGLAGAVVAASISRGTARVLERTTYPEARLAPATTHWFKLTLGPGEGATFSATFSHAAGDVDLALEAEDGTPLRASQGTGDRERIRYVAPPPGETVFLRVTTKDAAGSPGYVLEVR
ncbi:MAG: hypothetical protein M9894_03550 [Planctomycetes bacterium]|nr:hypothetical protein [Planctomycetota bacterium]